jgi:hypothetical protein
VRQKSWLHAHRLPQIMRDVRSLPGRLCTANWVFQLIAGSPSGPSTPQHLFIHRLLGGASFQEQIFASMFWIPCSENIVCCNVCFSCMQGQEFLLALSGASIRYGAEHPLQPLHHNGCGADRCWPCLPSLTNSFKSADVPSRQGKHDCGRRALICICAGTSSDRRSSGRSD